jgi:hypothetical protein
MTWDVMFFLNFLTKVRLTFLKILILSACYIVAFKRAILKSVGEP